MYVTNLISVADAGARILEFYTCRGEQFEDNNIQWRLSPVSKISFFTITTENFECRVPCSCCHPIPPSSSSSSNGKLRYVIHIGRLCVIDHFVTNQRTKTIYLFIVTHKLVIHSMRHPTVVSGARLCIEFRNWLSLDGCSKTICTDSVKYLAQCAADLPKKIYLPLVFTLQFWLKLQLKIRFCSEKQQ